MIDDADTTAETPDEALASVPPWKRHLAPPPEGAPPPGTAPVFASSASEAVAPEVVAPEAATPEVVAPEAVASVTPASPGASAVAPPAAVAATPAESDAAAAAAADAAAADAAPRAERPPMLQTISLTKSYKNLIAVRDLDLVVREGDVFGFIGPNGAGKTTTIKIFATLLRPTHGDALVGGMSVRRDSRAIRHIIGYMPDFFGVYEEMRVTEYLEFFAAAYKIAGGKRRQVVADVLELTDLAYKKDEYVKALSRGMQQRLGVARVLLHDPKVLLLDEPASGLDPRARIEMRALLMELQRMGKTILISSHILTELGEMCNTIGIIERGQLLYQGTVREIVTKLKAGLTLEVDVRERRDEAVALLERLPELVRAELTESREGEPYIRVKCLPELRDPSFVARALFEGGFALTRLAEEPLNLEEVFLQVTKGIVS